MIPQPVAMVVKVEITGHDEATCAASLIVPGKALVHAKVGEKQ